MTWKRAKPNTAGKFNATLCRRHNSRLHECHQSGNLRVVPSRPRLLLGCTYDDWAKHLGLTESDELTADRTIDHIIPIYYYDLNNGDDLYRCFNYKNTQLLDKKDNYVKGAVLPDDETLLKMADVWPVGWFPKLVEPVTPLINGESRRCLNPDRILENELFFQKLLGGGLVSGPF